jgi:hypothetical protein
VDKFVKKGDNTQKVILDSIHGDLKRGDFAWGKKFF